MKRPLVLISASGVATRLDLWETLSVVDASVVLTNRSETDDAEPASLVLARLKSVGEAQALFRTINDRMSHGARRFDARDWPGLVRDDTDDSAEGGV